VKKEGCRMKIRLERVKIDQSKIKQIRVNTNRVEEINLKAESVVKDSPIIEYLRTKTF
jgi:hypothetical protein